MVFKYLTMKLYHLLALSLLLSCTSTTEKAESDLIPNDTIRTGSGLQYYYLKKGTGRQIQDGSMVKAYNRLYLNDVDTVFWSTDNDEDSTFSYIHGRTSLIEGALELYPLLREGDELVAIMPDSIAYGKEDRNGLPGGSTLIFNPIKIKFVSEPKESLSDTLIAVIEDGSVEDMMSVYQDIMNSELKDKYHTGIDLMGDLYDTLLVQKRFAEVEEATAKFEAISESKDDLTGLWYYRILAVAQSGDTTRAIQILNETIEKDPDESYWKSMLEGMTKTEE